MKRNMSVCRQLLKRGGHMAAGSANIDLSVLVAVYNADKYLEDCMESLLSQSIEKMEVIVVDDGSKDQSLQIIEKYKSKFSHIKIISKKNEGTLLARLEGMYYARGKYIMFIDGDDTFVPYSLQGILETAIQKNVDILEFGYNLLDDKRNKIFKPNMGSNKAIEDMFVEGTRNCLKLLESHKLEVPLFKRIYRRRVCKKALKFFLEFTDYKIRFQNILSEDEFITPLFFANAKSYYCVPQKIYNYTFQTQGGITHSIVKNTDRMIKGAEEYMLACMYISKELKKRGFLNILEYFDYNMQGIDFFLSKSKRCKVSKTNTIKGILRYYSVVDIIYIYIGKSVCSIIGINK